MIEVLHVVIPVHDEAELLGGCLRSVLTSGHLLRLAHPRIHVGVTVVLDACTDDSAAVAATYGVSVVQVHARAVGAARAAGFAQAEEAWSPRDPRRIWMLSTDADTRVPATWLRDHHAAAGAGLDLLVGAVSPDPRELSRHLLAAWRDRHRSADVHVHGANLGVRLSAYRAVGGYAAVDEHEDIGLVDRLRAAGTPWTAGTTVTTSARERGRTPGGFAGYLRALRYELSPGSDLD